MDYTAIIVAFTALVGVVFQTIYSHKQIKKQDLKYEIDEVTRLLKSVQGRIDILAEGEEYTLQDRLWFLCTDYINKGKIPSNQLKTISNLYYVYHELGGNDFITELYERVKDLPIAGREV